MISKKELIEQYVKEVRNKVRNFDWKVQTTTLLLDFFKKNGYNFFFTPQLKSKKEERILDKNPDFHINKIGALDILGEIKQSLPNPNGDNYDKKVENDLNQLRKYKEEIMGISTPHDVFFASSGICNEAIAYYIKKMQENPELKDKLIVLKYNWNIGASHSRLTINKVKGNFSDKDIDKEFDYKDYEIGEGDLNKIQGLYKILYTEEQYNETPVEYIMVVLWHNIIPELIKSAEFDKTIERIKKGENTLEFDIDEIMGVLDKIYTLQTAKNNYVKQFSKNMIIDAMSCFEKINKAKKIIDSKSNPRYRITHSKIASQKGELIDYLIRELNKEEFEKKADVEYQRSIHKGFDKSN